MREYQALISFFRLIYSEAHNQSEKGKRGVAFVAKNRKDKNINEKKNDNWDIYYDNIYYSNCYVICE